MENTNCRTDCSFVKSGFCNTDKECPFYCESIWQLQGTTEVKIIKDCSPKRQIMEQNNLHYKFSVLQQLQEDLRNRLDRIELLLNSLIKQSEVYLIEKMKDKDLKDKIYHIANENKLKNIE